LSSLRAFFHCRDGMARGFLLKDMAEFWFSADGTPLQPIGSINQFGTGDGATTIFGLYKAYTSGGVTRTRRIIKPVSGSVLIYKDAVLQTLTTHYTINYTTGIVTFVSAPANGAVLGCKGLFYVPVRFMTDFFNVEMNDAVSAISYNNLPMLEIPPAEFDLDV
jgi:uncharacterized protein (TIGR02217 family)